jgi:DNA (cytosine-5)-methyltransferase 1
MTTRSLVSLFTGAGGLDLGLESAGFETRVAVECDPDAVGTLRSNREWPVIDADIHSDRATSDKLLACAELKEGDIDLLAGGPPCQPFSKSGYWARGDSRRLEDPRATTLEAYLRVLRDLKPKAFLLENVPGLAYNGKSEGLRLLAQTIRGINADSGTGYSFEVKLLKAAEYGVPQERERVFVIGQREGKGFSFPDPTHALAINEGPTRALLPDPREPYLSAWDAIGDLEEDDDPSLRVTGKWADLLPSIPEGENYLYHTERGRGMPLFGWRRRYWSFLLKLSKRLPSWTIAATPGPAIGPFHWRNRRLSARELCRLQTFPEGWKIVGSQRSVRQQLGNAVPCALAERVGLEIRAQFFEDEDVRSRALSTLPPRRGEPPPPEPVRDVPKKYWSLVGHHDPHPGTGKGYGAVARAASDWQPDQDAATSRRTL